MDYNYWKNGAGKTTLLESMMQLVKYNGTMFYENRLLKKIKDAAQNMYLVYQNSNFSLLLIQFMTKLIFIIIILIKQNRKKKLNIF